MEAIGCSGGQKTEKATQPSIIIIKLVVLHVK
jgi:hypothetical protein